MTQNDHEAIAQAFRRAKAAVKDLDAGDASRAALIGIAFAEQSISDTLAADNKRFDPLKFVEVCRS